MSTNLPEGLAAYLTARDSQRNEQVASALEKLTPAELKLVEEAAVMGYVLGKQAPQDVDVPPDSAILQAVVAACLAMSDLYPAISSLEIPGGGS